MKHEQWYSGKYHRIVGCGIFNIHNRKWACEAAWTVQFWTQRFKYSN